MTIKEALDFVNGYKESKYSDEQKIKWLNACEADIYNNIICQHEYNEDEEEIEFNGYDSDTDEDTEMIVFPPYDSLYTFYLMAQIAMLQHEFGFFNNYIEQYKAMRDEFYARWHQDHLPKQNGKIIYY
jgi:hypothetical protein